MDSGRDEPGVHLEVLDQVARPPVELSQDVGPRGEARTADRRAEAQCGAAAIPDLGVDEELEVLERRQ